MVTLKYKVQTQADCGFSSKKYVLSKFVTTSWNHPAVISFLFVYYFKFRNGYYICIKAKLNRFDLFCEKEVLQQGLI